MSWNKQRRLEEACARVDFDAMQREMTTPECLGYAVVTDDKPGEQSGRRMLTVCLVLMVEDDTPLKAGEKYVIGGRSDRNGVHLTVAV